MPETCRTQRGNDTDGKLHDKLPVQPGVPNSKAGNFDSGRIWNCSGQRILETLWRRGLEESMPGNNDDGGAAAVPDRSPAKKPFILVSVVKRFTRAGRLTRTIKSIAKSPMNVATSFTSSRPPREYLTKRRP